MNELEIGIVLILFTSFMGFVTWSVKEMSRARRESTRSRAVAEEVARKTTVVITKALVVILRNNMVTSHRAALTSGKITYSERASFMETNELYSDLGGNGPAEDLIKDICNPQMVTVVADSDIKPAATM